MDSIPFDSRLYRNFHHQRVCRHDYEEATLYKRTKTYKTRIEARKNEVVAMALKTVINDYWNVKKTHPDCNKWCLGQWHDYYAKQNESRKEKENEQ